MNIRTQIVIILGIIVVCSSCRSTQKDANVNCKTNFKVLDSIEFIVFPDDNFETKGNSVFQKIKNKGDSILPCLIETIKDTTQTQIRVADAYNYKKGDLAILMLPYVSNKSFPIREPLFDEFKKEFKEMNKETDLYSSLYHFIFFSNSDEINYQNRIRFYEKLKKQLVN